MDLVGFERARFDEVSKEITAYLASIGATPMVIVPISARDGDNIAKRSSRTPWYDGPTVLSALDGFHGHPGLGAQSLRLPIQDVYKFDSRSEEHTSELQSLMRISYAGFCLKKKTQTQ